ncbi:MAG: cell division protein ZapA [Cytophagales bacterium]|nr:MAG: cell division protein ZapA [Cytophagales bacterium]
MEERLTINLKFAGTELRLKSPPEEEYFIRQAAAIILERIDFYRSIGVTDNQEVLSRIAVDSVVARLKGDEQVQRMQRMVFDKITQLDQSISMNLTP